MPRRFVARTERPWDHALDVAIVAGWLGALSVDGGAWFSRGLAAVAGSAGAVSDAVVVVGVSFVWYLIVFWAWGIFSLVLDRARPAWAERRRLQVERDDERDDERFDQRAVDARREGAHAEDVPLARAVALVLFNQVGVTLPLLALVFPLFVARGLVVHGAAPPWWVAVLLVLAAFSWVEVSFYVVHRAMHGRRAFRAFHHIHHRYRRPTGIATHYAHPVDHLLGNLVPVLGGAVIVAVHPSTLLLWITLAVRNAIVTHGDVALPLVGAPAHHDFHHHDPRGNFGVVGLLDRLLGTDGRFRAAQTTSTTAPPTNRG